MSTSSISSIDTDLVVIGGGGSGLAAALRARELGVENVVVLEKTPRTGGNAWVAVVMLGLGDPLRLESDLTPWRDQSFEALMQFSNWVADPTIFAAYLDTYPDVVRWLIAMGMEFDSGGFEIGGGRFSILRMIERKGDYKVTDPSRGPGFIGSTVTDLLAAECRTRGVKILTQTQATKILLDDSETEVRGVQASGPEGEFTLNTRKVILAAGGFGANEQMLRRFFPENFKEEGPLSILCLGASTGDGLAMAEDIGLQIGEDMDSGIMGPSHHPWSHSIHETVHRPEVLWVNARGERFVNECTGVRATYILRRQPGGYLWALLDSSTKDYVKANPSGRQVEMGGEDWLATLDEDLAKEAGWKRRTIARADTLDELAAKTDMDAGTLKATVARYNELCEQGRDADFVKPAAFLRPLRTPPYYALLGVRFCHGTTGGVTINGRMEVKGRRGQKVEGLWATGDNTSGWVTDFHLPGTTLGFAFTSGYIAGENAAKS